MRGRRDPQATVLAFVDLEKRVRRVILHGLSRPWEMRRWIGSCRSSLLTCSAASCFISRPGSLVRKRDAD